MIDDIVAVIIDLIDVRQFCIAVLCLNDADTAVLGHMALPEIRGIVKQEIEHRPDCESVC